MRFKNYVNCVACLKFNKLVHSRLINWVKIPKVRFKIISWLCFEMISEQYSKIINDFKSTRDYRKIS